jgi:hypothetical protein
MCDTKYLEQIQSPPELEEDGKGNGNPSPYTYIFIPNIPGTVERMTKAFLYVKSDAKQLVHDSEAIKLSVMRNDVSLNNGTTPEDLTCCDLDVGDKVRFNVAVIGDTPVILSLWQIGFKIPEEGGERRKAERHVQRLNSSVTLREDMDYMRRGVETCFKETTPKEDMSARIIPIDHQVTGKYLEKIEPPPLDTDFDMHDDF